MENFKYELEYKKYKRCFWRKEPGKLVKYFIENIKNDLNNCKVLDLGAGEGKNSVYLANKGAEVYAFDLSEIALNRFKNQPNYKNCKRNIHVEKINILDLEFENSTFDIIITYGILHCLNNVNEIIQMVNRIYNWLKKDGYFVCVTFTDELPPPLIQDYLFKEAFIKKDFFNSYKKKHKILYKEFDIIEEIHPTSNIKHKHSLIRILTQKL